MQLDKRRARLGFAPSTWESIVRGRGNDSETAAHGDDPPPRDVPTMTCLHNVVERGASPRRPRRC